MLNFSNEEKSMVSILNYVKIFQWRKMITFPLKHCQISPMKENQWFQIEIMLNFSNWQNEYFQWKIFDFSPLEKSSIVSVENQWIFSLAEI